MKKLILSLLIFFSVISQAQIQIPQVVGLPSALASKATKTELDLKQTVFTGICQEQFLTENDIVIDNTALTLTIATVKNGQPISALNPICFYTDGNGVAVKHEKSTPVVFNFTNTDGIWYFYFNSSGNPIATQTSWSDFSTMASVYRFYWNSTLTVPDRRVIESIEYHKNDISWSDHVWKHSDGTRYLSGFNISHNATVSATPNINGSNAVVTLSSGSNIDDNMEYSVTHAASGSVKFTQNLGTGLLPATSGKFICISNDASLKLQKIPATDFPFLWNPTTNIPQYLTATGVCTDVGNGYFFVYYIYALQDPRYGEAIKIKSAETDFASSTLAAAHNWEQLQAIFPTLRDGEIRLLYKLTFEYKSSYDIGTKKAALRVVDDLRKQKTTTTATAGGLLPATSVVVSPIGNIASTNVQSALQELDSEKQPVGTYSTDIHSNITALNAVSGTNTGDETLTSIKTKLGAATSVSDGYLKYQDFALLHAPTTVTASNGLSISGQNISLQNASLTQSGALTFNDYNKFDSKEPAITKNSGFNLPLGTTTGTVLEGRTFGTAAGSAVVDFAKANTKYPSNLNALTASSLQGYTTDATNAPSGTDGYISVINFDNGATPRMYASQHVTDSYGDSYTRLSLDENATTWSGWRKMYDSSNLTSSLTTNNIGKWNGSNFVNSLVSETGSTTYLNNNGATRTLLLLNDSYSAGIRSNDGELQLLFNSDQIGVKTNSIGTTVISTTHSTLPTNGALVVNGGVGADHVRANNFYGNGSNLTGVQLPITLTTNGTSGAATFGNGVINVPNYDVSGGVNQTQTTVNGSTSGNMVCSMPFRTGSYKKVIIYINSLNGNATYTFPVAFTYAPTRYPAIANVSANNLTTSIEVSAAAVTSGFIILEGY